MVGKRQLAFIDNGPCLRGHVGWWKKMVRREKGRVYEAIVCVECRRVQCSTAMRRLRAKQRAEAAAAAGT